MKYPLGRLVITATCSPGLPMVVRFLVRSSVRPAAAPESTWIAASRSGPAAPGALGGGRWVSAAGSLGGAGGALGAAAIGVCAGSGLGAGGGVAGFATSGAGPSAFRLVWVSPIPASGFGGGGAALAGLRMIIVFSKSAA